MCPDVGPLNALNVISRILHSLSFCT